MPKIESIKEVGYRKLKDDALNILELLIAKGALKGKRLEEGEIEHFEQAIGNLQLRNRAVEMS